MIARETGDWLTAARVERLPLVLRAVRAHPPPGIATDQAPRFLWKACGGPLDDVPQLLTCLAGAGLILIRDGHLRTTRAGHQVATQDHQHGGTLLARALIRAGYFTDQSRRLGELCNVDRESGNVFCRRSVAVNAAPQLVGLLRRFPGVTFTGRFLLPVDLARELADVWALPVGEAVADPRKQIGDRGEFYSYRYEQTRAADPGRIRWVARDDDTLGYDIEDLNYEPRRRIEVKASTGSATRFILSSNEWAVAHREVDTYEIQFWGGISLLCPLQEEYAKLRKAEFPIIYRDLPMLLADGDLMAVAAQYLVRRPADTST